MSKILVVEDENIVAWDIQESLEKLGHTVLARVASGIAALQAAETCNPDLVLMDIRLAGEMDGVAAAQEIYSRFDIPVVYLTAHSDDDTLARATATSPFGYMLKPFQRRELHATIQVAIQRHQVEQRFEAKLKTADPNSATQGLSQGLLQGLSQGLLQEQNSKLEQFQLGLISQVRDRTAQLDQAIACTQVLNQVFGQIYTAETEDQILKTLIQHLGQVLDADYCWISLYSGARATSTVICEYHGRDRDPLQQPSVLGIQTNLYDYPQFYSPLLAKQLLLEPSIGILPEPYQAMLEPANQVLVCPIWVPEGVIAGTVAQAIGEIGILTTGKPEWVDSQAILIAQIVSHAVGLFRQASTNPKNARIETELEQLNYLKADFISSVSHELRTPLTNMVMVTEMLGRLVNSIDQEVLPAKTAQNPQRTYQKLQQYLKILQEELQREVNLVSDLLTFQDVPSPSKFLALSGEDFKQWFAQLVARHTDNANSQGRTLRYRIDPNLRSVKLHFPSLERVVTELLSNACKFTPPNQRITLTVGSNQEVLRIRVRNTGVTISDEERERIFEPFYRTPRPNPLNYSGTGFGLALVQKLVQRLGGEIQVVSFRWGTIFIVTIPIINTEIA